MGEYLIRNEFDDYGKVFIYDFEGEWSMRLGVEPVYDYGAIAERDKKGERIICYNPANDPSENPFDDFNCFVFMYAQAYKQKILVVLDELQTNVNQYIVPEHFKQVLLRGRRYKIDMIMMSHSPNLIHNVIRGNLSEIITFIVGDTNAVKFIRSFGVTDDEVYNLNHLQFIRKEIGGRAARRGVLVFNKKKGVDIEWTKNDSLG